MATTRLLVCTAALALFSVGSSFASPAYVTTTVNLRAGAGTNNEIIAKIPGGSLVDATNCTDWCEIDWQGKKGFAIASAIDRSGRVPVRRAPRIVGAPEEYTVVAPPPAYYRPPVYYYGYRPYYWGYRRWRYW